MVVKWFKILMSHKRHVFNVINTSSNVHGEKNKRTVTEVQDLMLYNEKKIHKTE
jgi:hypothetical protein